MAQLAKVPATKSYSFILGAVVVKIINFCRLFSYLYMSNPQINLFFRLFVCLFFVSGQELSGSTPKFALPSFLPFLLYSIIN